MAEENKAAAPAQKKEKAKKTFEAYKAGRMCPKCGARLGEHQNRYACGKCGYMEMRMAPKGEHPAKKE
ncbi:MAG: 30S ribosomal protein S27ae [Candidatus Micrarchaeota archaeon]|nr:30S ribosomal protein S27ae [Candidatus Micrarchaeota archaeon]